MARGAHSTQAPRPAKQQQPDTEALQAELKSFASGLGLASAGTSSGFDDSDFRPAAASQRKKVPIKGSDQRAAIKRSSGSDAQRPPARRQHPADRQERGKAPRQPAAAQQQAEAPDIVRERTWNTGVGQRPGTHGLCAHLPWRTETLFMQLQLAHWQLIKWQPTAITMGLDTMAEHGRVS